MIVDEHGRPISRRKLAFLYWATFALVVLFPAAMLLWLILEMGW
ncbi:hypothetical protein [Actinomadura sp. SCN-SB]